MSVLQAWPTSALLVSAMPATVVVPSVYGLQVPVNGLELNQKTLQVSCDAVAGPILSTAIPSSNSVGTISGFSLTFSPRLVSVPTSITMSVVLNSNLEPRNIVQLILPGFRGPSAASLNFSASTTDGNHVPVTGQWDLASTTLTVQVQKLAIRNKPFAFTVDTSSKLQLPAAGIQVNQTGFYVSTNATSGYVSPVAVYAQPVSIFASQKIDFSSAAALMPCGLNLSFSLDCGLSVGDEIFLRLPNFGGDMPVLNLSQAGAGANFSGSWQAPLLSLRVRRNVASRSIQWAHFTPTQGITVPEAGVSLNQGTITLSVNAVCGSVDQSPFPDIAPIGAFRSTSLEFLPNQATIKGAPVGIRFRFAPVSPIANGDVVFLILPKFRGDDVATLNVSTESGPTWEYTGSFALGPVPILRLTAAGALSSMQMSSVHIRISNGIMLPVNGLTHNQTSLLIGSTAASGPSVGQPILNTPAVGVFTMSTLHFGSDSAADSRAHTSTSMRLRFAYNKDISPTETVTLQLPLFSGPPSPLLAISGSTSLTASWNPLTYALNMTFNSTLSAGTVADISIHQSNGIILPITGVDTNQSQITLAATVQQGSCSAVPVLFTEPVGAVLVSSLDFVSAAATMSAQVVFSYTMSCGIEIGDSFTLSLPEFYGTDESTLNISTKNFNGSWSAASSTITLIATQAVPAQTAMLVRIEPSPGIKMPVHGVAANETAILLAVSARRGPTLGVAFQRVGPIGAFLSTELDFVPRAATQVGFPVEVQIRFLSRFRLSAGDTVFLTLPGFRAASIPSLRIVADPLANFSGSFSLASSEPSVLLTAVTDIAAMRLCYLQIASASGIMLPVNGLTHNQTSLLIGSTAASGPSVGQPILNTPAVGVFTMSTLHFGSDSAADSRAHTSTSMRLRFAYNKDISPTETVTLQLPLFSGPPSPLLAISGSTSLTASWNPLTYALNMTFNSTLSAGTVADISIHQSNGIILPITGVDTNQSQITLAATVQQGSCSAVPVLFTEPVGAVLVSSLDFVSAAATMSAQVVFSYTMSCGIEIGDSFTLSLPEFYGTDESTLNISTKNFNGSWSAASSTITLIATQAVPAQTAMLVRIEPSPGIKMPVHGVAANETAILLAVSARRGPTLGVAFQRVGPIGAFLSTELDLSPRVASFDGIPIDLKLRFRLNTNLTVAPGESIFLALPGFRGLPNGTYSVLVETVGDYIIRVGPRSGQTFRTFSGVWSNVTEQLKLVANDYVRGQIDMTIPKESSLALPQSGTQANFTSFELSTNAALGPSAGQPILKSPSVGSFKVSSVSFLNARAGGLADIRLNFTLMNSIAEGESVSFTLPDFSGPNISIQTLRQAVQFNFTWKNDAKKLQLTFLHSINPETLVSVTIPASFNIKIPDDGIRADHPITIETNAQSGPVEGIPVMSISSVGVHLHLPTFFLRTYSLDCVALPCS